LTAGIGKREAEAGIIPVQDGEDSWVWLGNTYLLNIEIPLVRGK
jgi:hypothetical protein